MLGMLLCNDVYVIVVSEARRETGRKPVDVMTDSCPHEVQSLTFQPREAQQAPPQGDASAEVFLDSVFFLNQPWMLFALFTTLSDGSGSTHQVQCPGIITLFLITCVFRKYIISDD